MIELSLENLLAIHAFELKKHGGMGGMTSHGYQRLQYAVSAPFLTMCNEELYPTIEAKAAILMKTIVCDHPFFDGNKRTGLAACLVFLDLNGFTYDFSEDEGIKLTFALAAGEIDQEELTDWIEKIIVEKVC